MKKSRAIIILISVICTIAICVGTTFALLSTFSGPVDNTFTVGKVEITLTESSGNTYHILPGATLKKDPVVTVKNGSEDCWLFVKVKESPTLHHYLTYGIDSGWTALDGESDVYYRSVEKPSADLNYYILDGNSYTVKDTVTKETLKNITTNESLTIYAVAVQRYGLETAVDAWSIVKADITA